MQVAAQPAQITNPFPMAAAPPVPGKVSGFGASLASAVARHHSAPASENAAAESAANAQGGPIPSAAPATPTKANSKLSSKATEIEPAAADDRAATAKKPAAVLATAIPLAVVPPAPIVAIDFAPQVAAPAPSSSKTPGDAASHVAAAVASATSVNVPLLVNASVEPSATSGAPGQVSSAVPAACAPPAAAVDTAQGSEASNAPPPSLAPSDLVPAQPASEKSDTARKPEFAVSNLWKMDRTQPETASKVAPAASPDDSSSATKAEPANASLWSYYAPPASQASEATLPLPNAKSPPPPEATKTDPPVAKTDAVRPSATNRETPATMIAPAKLPLAVSAVSAAPVQSEAQAMAVEVAPRSQIFGRVDNAKPASSRADSVPAAAVESTSSQTAKPTPDLKPATPAEAPPQTVSEKKNSATEESDSVSQHDGVAPQPLAKEAVVSNAVAVSAEPANAAAAHNPPAEISLLPKTQQMLDSTPATPVNSIPPPLARVGSDPAGDLQMHLGIRTTAFGSVEIQTTVHQSQVGLSVHAENGLARWFSSEVPSIEAGLKDHHLNLANIQFDGQAGIQTATSFHHEPSQRNFSAGSRGGGAGDSTDSASEPESVESAITDLPIRSAEGRVSIRV